MHFAMPKTPRQLKSTCSRGTPTFDILLVAGSFHYFQQDVPKSHAQSLCPLPPVSIIVFAKTSQSVEGCFG